MAEKEYWYRVDNRTMCGREIGYPYEEELRLWALPALRHTPKGVWLDNFGEQKFVLKAAHKQFACPTPEAALESFKARKRRQIGIISARLKAAKEGLEVAEKLGLTGVQPVYSSFVYLSAELPKAWKAAA